MKLYILASLLTLALSAGEPNGLFLGLGASYNSVKVDQQFNGTAFSSVFSGSALAALGEVTGSATPYHATDSTLAPQAQLGYLHRFSNSCWFLGCKAVYQYLGLAFTKNNLDSFPASTYMTTGAEPFVGHFLINSAQTHVNHELSFLPISGYFFNDSCVYLGAGPVLFQAQQYLYGIGGSARINGTPSDVLGPPTNLSLSQWIWGGIAQLGWIYPFASSWFLDLGYSYAVTGNATAEETALFSHSLITTTAYTEEGIASVKTTQKITAQSFTITLNKTF